MSFYNSMMKCIAKQSFKKPRGNLDPGILYLFSGLQCLWCLHVLQKLLLLVHARMVFQNCFEIKLYLSFFLCSNLGSFKWQNTGVSNSISEMFKQCCKWGNAITEDDLKLTNLKPRGLLQQLFCAVYFIPSAEDAAK